MSKILKQFFLEPQQIRQLEREAERQDVSQAEIVRRALEEYLNK